MSERILERDGIVLDLDGGIARLVLDRPAGRNALDPPMAAALVDAAQALAARDDVRVVVLSAEGPMFCPGGDVGFFATAEDKKAGLLGLAGDLHRGMLGLAELDAPVIARVHGVAAGAGLSLVAFADISVVARGVSFTVAYTGIGLSPDGGSTWVLPRLIGLRRTAELMLTNRKVGAEEAQAIGLVTEVVDEDALDARVEELAARFASGPTAAFGQVKRLLRASAATTLEDAFAAEAEAISDLAAGPVGGEGIAAFLEKRRPDWT